MTSTERALRYDSRANLEVRSQDVEYLRHGDHVLRMRVYQPEGEGPFPAAVALHGGAWAGKEWLQNEPSHERLASGGLVVAALEFRTSQDAPHPAAQEDINYATRWLKLHAAEFNATADHFGGIGWSSGGHQIILAAMRHQEYETIALEGGAGLDGALDWVIMGWPVLDPVGRYHLAEERGNEALMGRHLAYFGSLEGMEAQSALHMLERGDSVETPPALLLQGAEDDMLPRMMSERFVELLASPAASSSSASTRRGRTHLCASRLATRTSRLTSRARSSNGTRSNAQRAEASSARRLRPDASAFRGSLCVSLCLASERDSRDTGGQASDLPSRSC